MISEPLNNEWVVWAPAKVNLYLEVLGKRADGYHELNTLMMSLNLYDTIRFREEESEVITLRCTNPTLSTGKDNLIIKAAKLLQLHTGCTRGISIHLEKRIPMGAGLGGGSSDAATTLTTLNRLWQLNLNHEQLNQLAAQLGSDVPFFLTSNAGWCTGRGEIVQPLTCPRPFWYVLICPHFGLSTAEVYGQLQVPRNPRDGEEILQAVRQGHVEKVRPLLFNRLQEPAEQLRPELTKFMSLLQQESPTGVLMSGSGTTVFAMCRDQGQGHTMVHRVRHALQAFPGVRTYLVRSSM